jgi:hypothetical protein
LPVSESSGTRAAEVDGLGMAVPMDNSSRWVAVLEDIHATMGLIIQRQVVIHLSLDRIEHSLRRISAVHDQLVEYARTRGLVDGGCAAGSPDPARLTR